MLKPSLTFWVLSALFFGCLAAFALRPLGKSGQPETPDKTLARYFMVVSDEPGKDVMPLKSSRADGQLITVQQPLPMPAGVSSLATGGRLPAAPLGSMSYQRAPQAEVMSGTGKTAKPGYDTAASGGIPQEEPVVPEAMVTVKIQDVQTNKRALAPVTVRQALEPELAKLARCCQDAVKSGYKLPAEITLVFTVGADGKVSSNPVGKPPLADQGFESCLAAAFRSLQFPQTQQAAVQVTVKLTLVVN